MNFYRIKKTSDGRFIPQIKIGIFNSWDGITKNLSVIWFCSESQKYWCSVDTIDEAKQVIQNHKKAVKQRKYEKQKKHASR